MAGWPLGRVRWFLRKQNTHSAAGHLPKINENVCPQKDLHKNIYASFILNSKKLEKARMSINRGVDSHTLSNWDNNNTDKSQAHHTEDILHLCDVVEQTKLIYRRKSSEHSCLLGGQKGAETDCGGGSMADLPGVMGNLERSSGHTDVWSVKTRNVYLRSVHSNVCKYYLNKKHWALVSDIHADVFKGRCAAACNVPVMWKHKIIWTDGQMW